MEQGDRAPFHPEHRFTVPFSLLAEGLPRWGELKQDFSGIRYRLFM